MGAHCRIRRWKPGTDESENLQPASRRYTTGPAATARPAGAYTEEMEAGSAEAGMPAHRREWHDD